MLDFFLETHLKKDIGVYRVLLIIKIENKRFFLTCQAIRGTQFESAGDLI